MNTEQSSASGSTTSEKVARKIKIISTVGESKVVEYDGEDWAGLKKVLRAAGYPMDNIKAMQGGTNHTFEHDHAVIPEGDFKLYLMPYKNKSGGEIKEIVKQLFLENREAARTHFGNYTQIKEDVLAPLIVKYSKATADQKETAKAFSKPVKKEEKTVKVSVPEKKVTPSAPPPVKTATPVAEQKPAPKAQVAPDPYLQKHSSGPAPLDIDSEIAFLDSVITTLQMRRTDLMNGTTRSINKEASKRSAADEAREEVKELAFLASGVKDVDIRRRL